MFFGLFQNTDVILTDIWAFLVGEIDKNPKSYQLTPSKVVRCCDLWPVAARPLTLARKPCFATFAGVGGVGGATPPLAFPNEAS